MPTLLMTGFPGFLGSALLPGLLERRPDVRAVCVVQERHFPMARRRLAELADDAAHIEGRVTLEEGDITRVGLGLSRVPDDITEVWHLAAVYDLTTPEALARRVNVDGTANVLELCRGLADLHRLQYVSTCYVSGRYAGAFPEDELDLGQSFNNHYESTKFEAEALVRAAMAAGLPATIYRPGIVVGDSRTGETLKYDGPYFVAEFLLRQPGPVAVLPAVDARVTTALVPRDFVIEAMHTLSLLDRSLGRTYALTDPAPPTAHEIADLFAGHLGKRVVWLPVPLGLTKTVLATVPGLERLLGMPAELLDYFRAGTTYPTTKTVADLADTGVTCPPFPTYADRLLDYMRAHPEVGSAAMV
jgi:nucleoside-diphosphate-sugar epimerase